jgi:hypothetical protein
VEEEFQHPAGGRPVLQRRKRAMPVIDKNSPQITGKTWKPMIRIDTLGGDVNAIGTAPNQTGTLVYAEGDSWFDKFTAIGMPDTNLLANIRLPQAVNVVDVAKIGNISSQFVTGHQLKQTKAMFKKIPFNAILYSGGGNDLKNFFKDFNYQEDDPNPAADEFIETVIGNVRKFIALRDAASNPVTRNAPILFNGYDYIQPRQVSGSIFGNSIDVVGPWLYPKMNAAGLKPERMGELAALVIDKLNSQLEILAEDENIYLIKTSETLTRPQGTDKETLHWTDEIHPTKAGFTLLAESGWNYGLAKALKFVP